MMTGFPANAIHILNAGNFVLHAVEIKNKSD